jgi:addiction module HigA family antidote
MAGVREIPTHPGRYIRECVLPENLSVKDAAQMLGVGRPALSNLLNENAALSPEMALRVEKAFGVKSEELLARQAEYDEFRTRSQEKSIAVRRYARSAVDIQASQIEAWSERTDARTQLPALLRKLVQNTGVNLSKVDFPAYDNAQRTGWDGQVETDTATPWTPAGKSGWEFGCNEDAPKKAASDYKSRTENTSPEERRETTFVFVTPKNWPGAEKWAKEKAGLKQWKNVIALDASNLEQWLEQSVAAQAWMADQLGARADDLISLEACWKRWASITDPELSKELFRDSVESHKKTLTDWLKQPASRPLLITAASEDEALAYLACLFENIEGAETQYYDRAVAIRSVAAFSAASRALTNFVAIVSSAEVEKVLAGFQKRQHTIIVRNQAVVGEIDIPLDLPSYETLKTALEGMEFDSDAADRLIRESGHSLTILRRRLSQVPEIQTPPWAKDQTIARQLIPMVFVGAWNSNTKADQEILLALAGKPYPQVERSVAAIGQSEQSPLWSVEKYRGIVSKIDALYAIHQSITAEDLEMFFDTARYVLCEDDPALDLPEDKRWAANLYGKSRNHSGAIREGICETLVLLAVHGNNLFRDRLGMNIEFEVAKVIRDLLKPFDPKTWLSQHRDLPRYAEAAPDEFLNILREDLDSPDPKVFALLKSADSGIFGSCPRSGLLWALELLAWKPERLIPVTFVLAELSKQKIEDNWSNKPEGSLFATFRSWMPQTAATIDQRKLALVKLARKYPEIGWRVCVEQFNPGSRIGHYSHRPRWRTDAAGFGQVVTREEDRQIRLKAIDIALNWPTHDERTLGELVERLQIMAPEDQERVWQLIGVWKSSGPPDEKRAALRERIRRYAFTRYSRNRKLQQETKDRARSTYDSLRPTDPVVQHKWLFAQRWVEESRDELDDDNHDFTKRDERIGRLRVEALGEIWQKSGLDGIRALCASGNAAGAIGWHMAEVVTDSADALAVVRDMLQSRFDTELNSKLDSCITGFLEKQDEGQRQKMLVSLIESFIREDGESSDNAVRVCKCAPFGRLTWNVVDQLPNALRERYWKEVQASWGRFEESDVNYLIDELMAVSRPRAAFQVAHLEWKSVETPRLVRLLREVATSDAEPTGYYQFAGHEISTAFESLDKRTDISRDELAQLEFTYIKALEDSEHGIPNLERQVAKSPQLFMHVVALIYKRDDEGQDPPEWVVREENREAAWQASYALLENAKYIPGTREDGTIDVGELMKWIAEVRELAERYSRKEVCDSSIGKLLSSCSAGADGIWPREEVRHVLEEIASNEIASGMSIGLYNSRGAGWRGEGGAAERVLASKYRNSSRQIAFEYPFVANMLEGIARSYDHDAERWDTDRKIRRRIRD